MTTDKVGGIKQSSDAAVNLVVTTQPNINLTQLRLRLDRIIKPNLPNPTPTTQTTQASYLGDWQQ